MTQYVHTVDPELLIKANSKAVADHEEHGTADVTSSVLIALGGNHSVDEMAAVTYRLMALAKVMHNGDGERHTLNVDGKEYKLVDQSLLRAAAKAPLKVPESIDEMAFEASELLTVALQEASG
jgi:hypothetical protein